MPFSENFDPETCTNHIYTILKSNGVIVLTSNLVIICSEKKITGMVWANLQGLGQLKVKHKHQNKTSYWVGNAPNCL